MVCVCIAAPALLPAAFGLLHAGHVHAEPHESCAVCVHFASAGDRIKTIYGAITASALYAGLFAIVFIILKYIKIFAESFSLVGMKIKMNS